MFGFVRRIAERRQALRELGATFERAGRDEFHFVEGERRLEIYAEMGSRPDYVVYRRDWERARWMPPHEAESLSPERREEILALFRRYLEVFGHSLEVDES